MQVTGNMVNDTVHPQRNNTEESVLKADEENEIYNNAEFEAVNALLDEVNSALDNLERRNDNIHAELMELLKSNVDIRKQFQESHGKEP